MSKGCGYALDESSLPGQLLKQKLARVVKKKKKGGRLVLSKGPGDMMESGEYDMGRSPMNKRKHNPTGGYGLEKLHSVVAKDIHELMLPALHQELNLPVLKPETYKKILGKIKTKIKDSRSARVFSKELANLHAPVLIKMYGKKHKGGGLFDPIEGLTPADRNNKLYALYSNLQAPIGDAFHRAIKYLVKKGIEGMNRRQQEGGRLIKNRAKLVKMRKFFKGLSNVASTILAPVAQALGPVALEAYGVPPLIAKPLGMLASKGIAGANKFIQSR
jgi:hypothetical protein